MKRKWMNRVLSFLLTLVLVLGMTPVQEIRADVLLEEESSEQLLEENPDGESQILSQEIEEKTNQIQDYLTENYINGKVITNGGDQIVKDEAGTTYTIGLKTSTGSTINSLVFKREGSGSEYKAGWYITDTAYGKAQDPTKGRYTITGRPAAEEGPYTFTATLKLFDVSAEDTAINDGTAEALASQEFTIILQPDTAKYQVAFKAVDQTTKEEIPGASIELQKDWSTIWPDSQGIYTLEEKISYDLTVEAEGYVEYSGTFVPTQSGTEEIELTPIVYRKITFDVQDEGGNSIEGASIKVKQGYWTTIQPETDGSWRLQDGVSYTYTVTADNYTDVTGTITPNGEDQSILVKMEKNISVYQVFFKTVSAEDKTAVDNAQIKVIYEYYDDYSWDWVEENLEANADGSFSMEKGTEYEYTVNAEGYKQVSGTITPSGNSEKIEKEILMEKDVQVSEEDQKKVDAVKEKFDDEFGALKPDYKENKNIAEMVQEKVNGYTDLDIEGISVSLNSSGDTDIIAMDGTIHYVDTDSLQSFGVFSENVSCTFSFRCGNAVAVSAGRVATIGWNRDFFKGKMEGEAETLTEDKIKGDNPSHSEVTGDLTLPQCMGTSTRQVWSEIVWETSDPSVISLEDTGYGSLIDPKKAVVNRRPEDKTVTLTATFQANDTILNTNVESVSDFETITKTFEVTVKGSGDPKPTEEELKEILDKYYTADLLKDFNTGETADLDNCQGDIQLPRYTQIRDENGKLVFENREITVTSDREDIISVNGYRANVDVFHEEDTTVNLTVTFTREDVSVQKVIPVTVRMITDEMLDQELALMEKAREHYFDGINNGQYADKDSITGDLHPFQEMYLDKEGNPVWVYDVKDTTGEGIIPDDFFEDPWEMEGQGYNLFQSSNPTVIKHDNLLVSRQAEAVQVTISSLLSSEKYGKFAQDHPDNEKLQKLYKQEVSVTVTVKGTQETANALKAVIEEAEELLASVTEGTRPGEYPKGTKETLQAAIDRAQEVLNTEGVQDKELEQAAMDLRQAMDECENSRNVQEVSITMLVQQTPGENAGVRKMEVRADAAKEAGYTKPEDNKIQATVLDALVVLHQELYGDDFTAEPQDYLKVGSSGFVTRIFGKDTMDMGFFVNNKYPVDEQGMGTTCNATVLENGDILHVFLYGDTDYYSDRYLYFETPQTEAKTGEEFSLKLLSVYAMMAQNEKAEPGCTITLKEEETGAVLEATTDEKGVAVFKAEQIGTYYVAAIETSYEYYIAPYGEIQVTKGTPEYTIPEGITAVYGDTLSQVKLPEGFSWEDGTLSVGDAGKKTFAAVFNPEDTENYETVSVQIPVTVQPKDGTGLTIPEIDENTDLEKLVIKDGDRVLEAGKDYTISKKEEAHLVTVTITFKGNYQGQTERSYTVISEEELQAAFRQVMPEVTAKAEENKVVVGWKPVENAGSYRIYRKEAGGSFKGLANVAGDVTSYVDETAEAGVTYYYTVKGFWEEEAQGVYTQYPTNVTVKIPVDSLETPQVSTRSVNYCTVEVTWNKVAGAEKYVIYRKEVKAGTSFKSIGTVSAGTLKYRDGNAKLGVSYYYTVKAYAGSIYSDYQKTVMGMAVPSSPILKGAVNSSTGVTVSWSGSRKSASGFADGYRVFRKTNGGSWKTVGTVGANTRSFKDTTGTRGTTYYYTVRAYVKQSDGTNLWGTYDAAGVKGTKK